MRLILIIIIAAIAFGVVQGVRHGCQFGLNKATLNCILHSARSHRPNGGRRSGSGASALSGASPSARSAAAID